MSDAAEKQITLECPWGGLKTFDDRAVLVQWLRQQVILTTELTKVAGLVGLAEKLNEHEQRWRNWLKSVQQSDAGGMDFIGAFKTFKGLCLDDPAMVEAKTALSENKPHVALAHAIWALDVDWMLAARAPQGNQASFPVYLALIETALARQDGCFNRQAQDAEFVELRHHWAEQLAACHAQARTDAKAQVEAAEDASRAQNGAMAAIINDASAELERFKQSTADLEDRFRKRLQLEAPVTYWTDKADKANKARMITFVLFSVGVLGGGSVVLGYVLSGGLPFDQPARLALLSIPFVLYVWLLRHVVRLFVRYNDEVDDARERVAMVKTFLALDDDQRVSEGERLVCLNALFRPRVVTGEDVGPSHPLIEALLKRPATGGS